MAFTGDDELKSFGSALSLDSVAKYDFVRYDLNRLSVKDTTTFSNFFEKVWTFESQDSGKVRDAYRRFSYTGRVILKRSESAFTKA